jgi:hypothetical protein
MRLTIIPSDEAVYVNEVGRIKLDLSACAVPANVHALQWYGTRGWIEFQNNDPFAPFVPNQDITQLPEWADACVAVWQASEEVASGDNE